MKKLISLLLFIFSLQVFADNNMRKCTLLPISDSVGGAISYKVFEELEQYLKESPWCLYKNNSEIMTILGNYKNNLAQHLENKDVLKVISEKLKVGSLIKIRLLSRDKGLEIDGAVIGSNGEDVYFKEKAFLETDDIPQIAQTIKNWLELYEKTIPYDGKVLGVLGEQVTIDIGKKYNIKIGQEFTVKRPTVKKKHPLLQEIVEYETISLGRGKITSVSETQALGFVGSFESERKIQPADWIKLEEPKPAEESTASPKFAGRDKKDFGKLGTISFSLIWGKGTVTSLHNSLTKKIGGYPFGFDATANMWITRNYFFGGDFGKRISSYNKKAGPTAQESYSLTLGHMKGYGGYKFLPMGFFFGPQIDLYAGYARYSFGVDTVAADGYGDGTLGGILVGIGANTPILPDFRAFGRIDVLPRPTYKESLSVLGKSSGGRSFTMELGTRYTFNPVVTFDGSLQFSYHKANFKSSSAELTYQDTSAKIGTTYSF